jgi:signal transduction histidine kinase
VSGSPLDEGLSLAQLLEVEGFLEVCRSFSELYGIGIKVYDTEANKIADVRASTGDHCGYLFTVHPTQVACTNLVNRVRTLPIEANNEIHTIDCFSGLRYKIQPLTYEGSLLGRFIFGPYAPAELSGPPAELKQYRPQLNLDTLAEYLGQIPRASDDTVAKVIEHVSQVFAVIIHSSYRTQVTSNMHIASIQGAFDDLEKTNRSLKLANDKLKELDRLKSNFIATVSHELRTPLTSVIGYSEMLLEGMAGELAPEQREYVNTILEKGESLLNLIGQVLDLSRIESGNVLIQKQEVDPRDLVDLAITDVTPQAARRDIELQIEMSEEVSPIVVDADKVRRVLTNLLANAVKFSQPNGVVRVTADIHDTRPSEARYDIFEPERNRFLRFEVADRGVGIPNDKLEQIFEAFFQVDNTSTREFGGTGLGLSIVRNFVNAHNGRVDVSSTPGSGSIFTVFLPYVADELGDGVDAEILTGQRTAS